VYAVVMEMRKRGTAQNAAVDTMGCERLGLDTVSPKVKSRVVQFSSSC
jgi:endonuclease-3